MPMNVAMVGQWVSTIKNAKGICQEEIIRACVEELLIQHAVDHKLTKKNLINHIKKNLRTCEPVLINERETKYTPSLYYRSISLDAVPEKVIESFRGQKLMAYEMPSFKHRLVKALFEDMFGLTERWFVFDSQWNTVKLPVDANIYKTSLEAIDALYSQVSQIFNKFSSYASLNYYERFSLLGGTNYREWFLCIDKWPEIYSENHFDIKNLLLHLRTSEWVDADGVTLLLVDEIQSDWNARRKLEDEIPESPFVKDWHELGIKAVCTIAARSGITRIAFTGVEHHTKRYGHDYEGLKILYDQKIPKTLNKLTQKYGGSTGWSTIIVNNPTAKLIRDRKQGWVIENKVDKAVTRGIKNQSVALYYLKAKGNKIKESVRVLDILPILVEAVKSKGLPLFGW